MVYNINDIINFIILLVWILFNIYLFINNKDKPPTPYTKVMGPTKTPLGFKMVFLKRVLSIIKPSNEYELDWKQIAKIGDDIILVKDKYAE